MNGKVMKGIVASIASIALMACAGCGGGGSGAAQSNPATAQKTVTIEFVGDSTVVGCTVLQGNPRGPQCLANYTESAHNEPATVQYLMSRQIGPNVTVINSGVAGTTVEHLLNGTHKVDQPWWPHVSQSKAQIIVVNYGLNDAYAVGMTPELFSAELDQVISAAKAAGKLIILETSNPSTNDHLPYLAKLVEAEKATAAKWGVTVIDQFGYLSSQPQWASMLSDSMHPTDAGYEFKAEYSMSILAPIVKSMM